MMANFIPFKEYILIVVDEFVRKYQISEPFLDVGCGSGDVSLHFSKKGWRGTAIDINQDAIDKTKFLLSANNKINVTKGTTKDLLGSFYNLVLFLDVIEHIEDDRNTLEDTASIQLPGSHLIITVPSNPDREWNWDDDFYGHLRRYTPQDLTKILTKCNYQIIEMWDVSFPIFWFMRRAFLILKQRPKMFEDTQRRTMESPFNNAWDMGWVSNFLSKPLFWKYLYKFQFNYRDQITKGNELAVLAKKK